MLPVWLDCDPGHDDALAMLLACGLPEIELVGVSTVCGNATLENTTNNAMALLTAFHHDALVFPGAEKPLAGFVHTASSIHGSSGLEGTALLPMPIGPCQPDHTSVAAIAEAIDTHRDSLILVATGPLTNIALLVLNYPDMLKHIRTLSIMGGGIEIGNWTPHAEFNIWCDAKAAQIVLQNEILAKNTILVPIDLTHKVLATDEQLEHIHNGNENKITILRQMLFELLSFFGDTYRREFGFKDGAPVHDVVAMAAVLDLTDKRDIGLKYYRSKLTVTTKGTEKGKISAAKGEGAMIAEAIDAGKLWALVYESIERVEALGR